MFHAAFASLQRLLERGGFHLARIDAAAAPGPARAPVGELRPFLAGLAARGFAPRQVLDVGAHRGAWSRTAREYFPAARFTLVEPLAELAPDLEAFCAEAPGSRWVHAGAAGTAGERPLTVFGNRGASTFLPGDTPAGGEEVRRLPTVTLDGLFPAGEPAPELVKLDVEGYELEVLAGARRLLAESELFVCEAAFFPFRPGQPTLADLVGFFAAHGWRPYDFAWFLRRPLDGALGLADVAFARAGGALTADLRWEH